MRAEAESCGKISSVPTRPLWDAHNTLIDISGFHHDDSELHAPQWLQPTRRTARQPETTWRRHAKQTTRFWTLSLLHGMPAPVACPTRNFAISPNCPTRTNGGVAAVTHSGKASGAKKHGASNANRLLGGAGRQAPIALRSEPPPL